MSLVHLMSLQSRDGLTAGIRNSCLACAKVAKDVVRQVRVPEVKAQVLWPAVPGFGCFAEARHMHWHSSLGFATKYWQNVSRVCELAKIGNHMLAGCTACQRQAFPGKHLPLPVTGIQTPAGSALFTLRSASPGSQHVALPTLKASASFASLAEHMHGSAQ